MKPGKNFPRPSSRTSSTKAIIFALTGFCLLSNTSKIEISANIKAKRAYYQ